MRLAASIFLLATAAFAQNGGIQGPVAGLVFDEPTKSIRPMMGVPGASYLGNALVSNLESASVSPNGRLALALREGKLGLLNLDNGAAWTDLSAASGESRFAWSRSSNTAAMSSQGKLILLKNLDRGAQSIPLGDLDGVISLAVDSQGIVAAGVANSGIFRASEGSAPELLARITNPVALALDANGSSLFAADGADNSILELADWRNTGGATLVANQGAGVNAPSALAVSANNRMLLIANGEGQNVLLMERATRAVSNSLPLDFKPTRMEALGDGSIFMLNHRKSGEPLQILSGNPDAQIFFVPVED